MAKWAARRIDSNSIAVLTCTCIETAVARKHQCIQVLCSFPTALSARTAELYVESRNPHAGLWHAQLPESQVLLGSSGHCHNCLVHACSERHILSPGTHSQQNQENFQVIHAALQVAMAMITELEHEFGDCCFMPDCLLLLPDFLSPMTQLAGKRFCNQVPEFHLKFGMPGQLSL